MSKTFFGNVFPKLFNKAKTDNFVITDAPKNALTEMNGCVILTNGRYATQFLGDQASIKEIYAWAESKGYDLLTQEAIMECAKEHNYTIRTLEALKEGEEQE